MTTDTELLPLPQWTQYNAHLRIRANSLQRRVQDYARANMAPLIAEIEGLRAEAAKLRNLRADAIHECALANARAELLAEALQYAIEQVPELATVPGIASSIANAIGGDA